MQIVSSMVCMVDLLDLLGLRGLIPSQNQPIQQQVDMVVPPVAENTSGLVTGEPMVAEPVAAAVTPDATVAAQPAPVTEVVPPSASIGEPMVEPAPVAEAIATTPDATVAAQPAIDVRPGFTTEPINQGVGETTASAGASDPFAIGVNTDTMHLAQQSAETPAPVVPPAPAPTAVEPSVVSQPTEAIPTAAVDSQPAGQFNPTFGQLAMPEAANLGGIAPAQPSVISSEQAVPAPDNITAFPSSSAAPAEPVVSEPLAA